MISTSGRIAIAFGVLLSAGCSESPAQQSKAVDAGRSASGRAGAAGASEPGGGDRCFPNEADPPDPEEVFCPSVACVNGVTFKTDFAWTFEQARKATFEVCRGDFCLNGMLKSQAPTPGGDISGSGILLRAPDVADPADAEGYANVTFFADGQVPLYLDVTWTPRSVMDLSAGDHYRASMTLDDKTTVLIDETVDYQSDDLGIPGCPCYQHCLRAEIDQRR